MDVGDDAAAGDRRLDQHVQLLVPPGQGATGSPQETQDNSAEVSGHKRRFAALAPDGELEVARRDPPSLQVLRRVTRQLQDLGEKDSSKNLFFTLGFLPTSAVRYSRMAAV